jgi:hypothetical protein
MFRATSMKNRLAAVVALALFCGSAIGFADDTSLECVMSTKDAGDRVFSTTNVWTILQLDTESGRLWQLQLKHANEPHGKTTINETSLVESGKHGPFTLCPTSNTMTYLIVNQDTGRTWQVQLGAKDGERGITEIDPKSAGGYLLLPPIN